MLTVRNLIERAIGMFLERLHIEGYKNFGKLFNIEFRKGLNVLVGKNAVGKTAIIDSVRSRF